MGRQDPPRATSSLYWRRAHRLQVRGSRIFGMRSVSPQILGGRTSSSRIHPDQHGVFKGGLVQICARIMTTKSVPPRFMMFEA